MVASKDGNLSVTLNQLCRKGTLFQNIKISAKLYDKFIVKLFSLIPESILPFSVFFLKKILNNPVRLADNKVISLSPEIIQIISGYLLSNIEVSYIRLCKKIKQDLLESLYTEGDANTIRITNSLFKFKNKDLFNSQSYIESFDITTNQACIKVSPLSITKKRQHYKQHIEREFILLPTDICNKIDRLHMNYIWAKRYWDRRIREMKIEDEIRENFKKIIYRCDISKADDTYDFIRPCPLYNIF